jgi:hypothetical protein
LSVRVGAAGVADGWERVVFAETVLLTGRIPAADAPLVGRGAELTLELFVEPLRFFFGGLSSSAPLRSDPELSSSSSEGIGSALSRFACAASAFLSASVERADCVMSWAAA